MALFRVLCLRRSHSHTQLLWSVCERFQLKAFVAARLPYDCRPCSSNARLKAKNNFDAVLPACVYTTSLAPRRTQSVYLYTHSLRPCACVTVCERVRVCFPLLLPTPTTLLLLLCSRSCWPTDLIFACVVCLSRVPCIVFPEKKAGAINNKKRIESKSVKTNTKYSVWRVESEITQKPKAKRAMQLQEQQQQQRQPQPQRQQ